MTAKEAKEQLKEYKRCCDLIEVNKQMLKSLDYGLQSADYSRQRVKESKSNEAVFARIAEKRSDLEKEIEAECIEAEEIKLDVAARIMSIKNPLYRQILDLRYIRLMKIDQIAKMIHYSEDHTKHLHAWALEEYAAEH